MRETQPEVPASIVPLLHATAGRQRGAALLFEGDILTWQDLESRSNQLANSLIARGYTGFIGVSLLRSFELVVALCGIIKAGAAWLPLDPDYPHERLEWMLTDAKPDCIVTTGDLAGNFSATTPVIDLVSDAEVKGASTAKPAIDLQPQSPAYVLYTSGSTGKPKGVVNTHVALSNRLDWMQRTFSLDADDTVLQKTPFSFDVSIWEFFWPLIAGARLALAKPGGHRDSSYLSEVIEQHDVSVLHFVPSMLSVFLDQRGLESRCKSLRAVMCSGEALPADLVRRFQGQLDAELHNLYGPTEAAIDVTHWSCPAGFDGRTVPIGTEIQNTEIHIVNEALVAVPDGETGELCIGGIQVALGYLNRDDLNRDRFITDHLSARTGDRLYRTGDLARRLPGGEIEFLGRNDFQVKINGNRVELTEIEATLEASQDVLQAVVIARTSTDVTRLIAYVRTNDPDHLDVEALRSALLKSLPPYMLPHRFVPLATFPVTTNGKLDRDALPDPDVRLLEGAAPPRGELETFIAGVWQQIIGLSPIGRDLPFFELGGTSIQAARFVNRMQDELGEFIYVVSLFDAPTVADYAAFLERDYAEAVARRFPQAASSSRVMRHAQAMLQAGDFDNMQQSIPRLPAGAEETDTSPVLERAIFILAPPRSGTTLLRVMLAGHPGLFSASELQLLCFNDLAERHHAFQGKFSLWLEGTLRALMELDQCDAETALATMQKFETSVMSTRGFYGELQRRLGDRILVDKSPHYALDPDALQKAEADFRAPFYVHLSRAPDASIDSFVNYHMDQVLYLHPHSFDARQLAELVWTISHENIREFLADVDDSRHCHIRFEELVTAPEDTLARLLAAAGLPFDEAVLNPYQDLDRKMTDGLHADSTPMGDTHFLDRGQIDASAASHERQENAPPLALRTVSIARALGYEPDDGPQAPASRQQLRARNRNRRQRRRRVR